MSDIRNLLNLTIYYWVKTGECFKINAAVSEMKQPFFIQTTNGKKILIVVVNRLIVVKG
jgi:hypothetical protein